MFKNCNEKIVFLFINIFEKYDKYGKKIYINQSFIHVIYLWFFEAKIKDKNWYIKILVEIYILLSNLSFY